MDEGREADHPDRVRRALDDGAAARSALQASWRRSMALHGLDPAEQGRAVSLTESQMREVRQAMEPLICAAQSTLDRLYLAVGGSGCCVLLTNGQGVAVDRRSAEADDDTFQRWGLWQGAVWSEAVEGTNGIGTCLAEHRQLTIHKDQHFHTRNIRLSCSTAPVHDHLGRLVAALDVSTARANLTEGFVGLISAAVAEAARAIEVQAFRQAFPQARIVLAGDAVRSAAALLAVDRHDLVVGATHAARVALGIDDARIAAHLPADDALGLASSGSDVELFDAEIGVVRRALARSGGNVSAAARALGVSRATLHRRINRLNPDS